MRAKEEPQAAKFAGGHRIRVTPVPIPNTEVKPDTADGTVWETVWESRSLPALFRRARREQSRRAFFVYLGASSGAAVCRALPWNVRRFRVRQSGGRAIEADPDIPPRIRKFLLD